MTTVSEDKQLADAIYDQMDVDSIQDTISTALKESIEKSLKQDYGWLVDWIGKNMSPEDVFDEKVLVEWAIRNGYERD